MVNREKNPWKGCWNGLGGKIEKDENPLESIIREVEEETGLKVLPSQVHFKGSLTWNTFTAEGQGLYIYLIDMNIDEIYETPRKVREGILDWKNIEWINDFENIGVAYNIPYFLPLVLNDSKNYHYHCTFKGNLLESVTKKELI
jgi:8-oxo-dGTP diphosphatase